MDSSSSLPICPKAIPAFWTFRLFPSRSPCWRICDMLTHRLSARLLILGLLLGVPALTQAGLIRTFAVEGVVTRITDPLGTLNFTELGAPVRFEFSFHPETPDLNETASLGVYQGMNSSLTIGGIEISSGSPTIYIAHPRDQFWVMSDFTHPGFEGGGFGFTLGNSSSDTALDDVSLPVTPYPLDLFPYRDMGATFLYPDPGSSSPYRLTIAASVDRFYLVPEPASGALAIVSLTSLLFRRRRWSQF